MTHPSPSKLIMALACICCFIAACNVSGQVGDTFQFRKDKQDLEAAIDTLLAKNPEYKTPANWAAGSHLPLSTSPYLENKTFYFQAGPQEVYCVTLIDDSAMSRDSARAGLAIRAINNGGDKWLLEGDMDFKEQKRVQKRFEKEIISRLEDYTNTKASKED